MFTFKDKYSIIKFDQEGKIDYFFILVEGGNL